MLERFRGQSLLEVVDAVEGKIPVTAGSGFRRGRDISKALALGASAVGIGRPYIWGLASFGREGVERAFEMLTAELELAMMAVGVLTVADIPPAHIGMRSQQQLGPIHLVKHAESSRCTYRFCSQPYT